MPRIRDGVLRAFKSLAGQDKDKPLTSPVIALYAVLFLMAMWLLLAWLLGAASD
jgi:hypothetical protein